MICSVGSVFTPILVVLWALAALVVTVSAGIIIKIISSIL